MKLRTQIVAQNRDTELVVDIKFKSKDLPSYKSKSAFDHRVHAIYMALLESYNIRQMRFK